MKQAAAQTTRKRGNALSRLNKNLTSLSVFEGRGKVKEKIYLCLTSLLV